MMISAWHLIWIIPLASSAGIFVASLMHISADADRRAEKLLEKD